MVPAACQNLLGALLTRFKLCGGNVHSHLSGSFSSFERIYGLMQSSQVRIAISAHLIVNCQLKGTAVGSATKMQHVLCGAHETPLLPILHHPDSSMTSCTHRQRRSSPLRFLREPHTVHRPWLGSRSCLRFLIAQEMFHPVGILVCHANLVLNAS
jgi:hypothetical protein